MSCHLIQHALAETAWKSTGKGRPNSWNYGGCRIFKGKRNADGTKIYEKVYYKDQPAGLTAYFSTMAHNFPEAAWDVERSMLNLDQFGYDLQHGGDNHYRWEADNKDSTICSRKISGALQVWAP